MSTPLFVSTGSAAVRRLLDALSIPTNSTTDAQLRLTAGEVVKLTVTRLVSLEELEALAEVFETENLGFIPEGTTTYNLVRKDEVNPTA